MPNWCFEERDYEDPPPSLVVSKCADCPFLGEHVGDMFVTSSCAASKKTPVLWHYESGPAPEWCPLRGVVYVVALREPPVAPVRKEPSAYDGIQHATATPVRKSP